MSIYEHDLPGKNIVIRLWLMYGHLLERGSNDNFSEIMRK